MKAKLRRQQKLDNERANCGALVGEVTTVSHVCRDVRLYMKANKGDVLMGFNANTDLREQWLVVEVKDDWYDTIVKRLE